MSDNNKPLMKLTNIENTYSILSLSYVPCLTEHIICFHVTSCGENENNTSDSNITNGHEMKCLSQEPPSTVVWSPPW